MKNHLLFNCLFCLTFSVIRAEEPLSKFEVLPLPNHEVSFQVDGIEKCRWHFGQDYPRPFFYPFIAGSGTSLTRMGHPGAANHDHHRSIWFAHAKVNGVNFWADNTRARIRQKLWLAYENTDTEATMASLLGWYDEEGREIMEQEWVGEVRSDGEGGTLLELQIELRPGGNNETVELEQTNFGILAVRVAQSISHHFGGGNLTDSEGREGEKDIFGKAARWMDYSGPIAVGVGKERRSVTEGITYFNHPRNPRHPVKWHVRSDGWMGASLCMDEGITITREKPLVCRYLLHGHAGAYNPDFAVKVFEKFAESPGFEVEKSKRPHRQYSVFRK